MRRLKKSQVSLFILLGMIIFIIFGFMFFAVKVVSVAQIEKEVDKVYSDFLRVTALGYYVDKCLKRVTQDGLYDLAHQGGHMYPYQVDDPFVMPISDKGFDLGLGFNFTYIVKPLNPPELYPKSPVYPCLKSDNIQGWPFCRYVHSDYPFYTKEYIYGLSSLLPLCKDEESCGNESEIAIDINEGGASIQHHLEKYIEQHLSTCVDIESILPAQGGFSGFNVTKGNVSADIDFGDQDMVVKVVFPVEFTQKNKEPVIRETDYSNSEKVRWKTIYKCLIQLIEKENTKLQFNLGVEYSDLSYCKDLFEVNVMYDVQPGIDVIRLIDHESILLSKPYEVTIGIKNRNPVLDYVGYNPGLGADIVVAEGSTIVIEPWAYDPDDSDNADLEYNYSGDGVITTSELQSSLMFNQTFKDTSYNTSHEDVGYHNVTLKVSDGYLIDYQIIRILVDDVLMVSLTGFNPFDVLDTYASIEDPYVITIHEDSPDMFNADLEREYIWSDYDEFPEDEETFLTQVSSYYPELVLPGYGQDDISILNIPLNHFGACPYYYKMLQGQVTSGDDCLPPIGILNMLNNFITDNINSDAGAESQFVTHRISLEINTTPRPPPADWLVNVTQCLPHRTGMGSFPDAVPSYPFSHFYGDSYPDTDVAKEFDVFLGNHTCCGDGVTSATLAGAEVVPKWGTVMPESTECYRYDHFFCGGPIARDENNPTQVLADLEPTAPNLNQSFGGPLLGNQVEPIMLDSNEVDLLPSVSLENDIFHRLFTVQCDGKRGNICNGTASDEFILNISCGDYDSYSGLLPDATQRCMGCGDFGTNVSENELLNFECKKYNMPMTFEVDNMGVVLMPDREGFSDFSNRYKVNVPGYQGGVGVCNPYWVCSSLSTYNVPGPYRAQAGCGDGDCDRPANLFCESNGLMDPGTMESPGYATYLESCTASPACDDIAFNLLPKNTLKCDTTSTKSYFRDRCESSCMGVDIPDFFVCRDLSISKDGSSLGPFSGCNCHGSLGVDYVDQRCHGVDVNDPYISDCRVDLPYFQDKCDAKFWESDVNLIDDDKFYEYEHSCGDECVATGCESTINFICGGPCEDYLDADPCEISFLPDGNACVECIANSPGLAEMCSSCSYCCGQNYGNTGATCWTIDNPDAVSNGPQTAGGIGCESGGDSDYGVEIDDDECNTELPGTPLSGRGQGCEEDCTAVDCEPYAFLTKDQFNSYFQQQYIVHYSLPFMEEAMNTARCMTQNAVNKLYAYVVADVDNPAYKSTLVGNPIFCADGYDLDIKSLRGNSESKSRCVQCTDHTSSLGKSKQISFSGAGLCESGAGNNNDNCNADVNCDEKDDLEYVYDTNGATLFCKDDCTKCTTDIEWTSGTVGGTKKCGCATAGKKCDSNNPSPYDKVADGLCVVYSSSTKDCVGNEDEGVTSDGTVCSHVNNDDDIDKCDTYLADFTINLGGLCLDTLDDGVSSHNECETDFNNDFCKSEDGSGSVMLLEDCDEWDWCEDLYPGVPGATNIAFITGAIDGVVYTSGPSNKCCQEGASAIFDSSGNNIVDCDESCTDPEHCDSADLGDDLRLCGEVSNGDVDPSGIYWYNSASDNGCCDGDSAVLVNEGGEWKCKATPETCVNSLSDLGYSAIHVPSNRLNNWWTAPCISAFVDILPYYEFVISSDVASVALDFMAAPHNSGAFSNLDEFSPSDALTISVCGVPVTATTNLATIDLSCSDKKITILNQNPDTDFKVKVRKNI
jgi:hypothetical protein